MKNLEIVLIGPKGSGKTTIARLIRETLNGVGLNVVSVIDKDIDKPKAQHCLEYCIESLASRVEVNISTSTERIKCKELKSHIVWE